MKPPDSFRVLLEVELFAKPHKESRFQQTIQKLSASASCLKHGCYSCNVQKHGNLGTHPYLAKQWLASFMNPGHHSWAWNFRRLLNGYDGSIEFRLPPGTTDSRWAMHWVAFTIAFVKYAITSEYESYANQYGENLEQMLESRPIVNELEDAIKYVAFPAFASEGSATAYKTLQDAILEPQMVYNQQESDFKRAATAEMCTEAELNPAMRITNMVPIEALLRLRYHTNYLGL